MCASLRFPLCRRRLQDARRYKHGKQAAPHRARNL